MIRFGTTTLILTSSRVASGFFVPGSAAATAHKASSSLLQQYHLVVATATTTTVGARTRMASSSAAEASVEVAGPVVNDDAPAQKWDVNRYQSSHSFVWKYGSSLLELIDYDGLWSSVANGATSGGTPILRALDVGCGSGQLTQLLRDELVARKSGSSTGPGDVADKVVKVFGMDLDPDMVRAAQQQHPDIRFFVGDARTIELPPFDTNDSATDDEESSPTSVHLVLSNAALHWIPPKDIDRAVQSISRVLVPGGQFVAEFGGRGNVQKIVKAMKHVFQTPSVSPPNDGSRYYGDDHVDSWYYPSIADFAGRLASHNIEVTSAALFDRPTLLDNGEDGMENWIRMFGGKYWRHLDLSPPELNLKIQQAVEWLRPDLYDASTGQWTADYRRIRVVGRKLRD